jgi:RNAse (barnase) inhibitor barstar
MEKSQLVRSCAGKTMKKTIIINGTNFLDLEGFYLEIDKVLTKDLTWETGHNYDAFNDLLRGGFGVYEYGESVKIIWKGFAESKNRLGNEVVEKLLEVIANNENVKFETEG